jgi:co-chaperonin GroES (HSP10)
MKLFSIVSVRLFTLLLCIWSSSVFAQDSEEKLFLFRIEEVKGCSSGICQASILGGQDIGITKLISGVVIAKYSKENPNHEGIISEKATVLQEGDAQTYIQVPVKTGQTVLVGDVFACKLSVPKNTKRSAFFNLAQNAIFFKSVYDKPYFSYYDAIYALTPAKEKVVIDSMVADIKYVGKFYQKDKAGFPVIKEGKFAGKNVLDAMLLTTPADVYGFFKFVDVNSKPYLANNWKISEKYATCLIN